METNEHSHWWFKARREIIKSVISSHTNPLNIKHVLEAGCGSGGNLSMASELGEVDAFELENHAKDIALKRNIGCVKKGSLPNNIPFQVNQYDLILILDVIEHLEHDTKSLNNLRSHLNKSGIICITAPAYSWLWSDHDELHHHHRRYNRKSLGDVCKNAGLTIEYLSYFNTLLFPLAAIVRLLQPHAGSNIQSENEPNSISNEVLYRIFRCEQFILNKFSLPYGLSLIAICKATETPCSQDN